MGKSSLLVIGMLDSTHLQKWVESVNSTNTFNKIWLFPSTSTAKFEILSGGKVRFLIPFSGFRGTRAISRACDLVFGLSWRRIPLSIAVKILSPDIIHIHEIQHAGYIFSGLSSWAIPKKSKIFCSTWGSDLIVYGELSSEKEKISRVLSRVNVLLTERGEEEQIARQLGFLGKCYSPFYATIGVQLTKHFEIDPSDRKFIFLKGYQDNHGRALNALRSLELAKTDLRKFEIYIFSASPSVRIQAELLAIKHNWKIKCLTRIPQAEMMNYYLNSRLTLSLGISDGISNSMIESMQTGAFPIQSENSCASIFLEDGVSGFIVDPWDLDTIANRIDTVLGDDILVDSAALINRKKLSMEFDFEKGLRMLLALYSEELIQNESNNVK